MMRVLAEHIDVSDPESQSTNRNNATIIISLDNFKGYKICNDSPHKNEND